jgi:hypothetical protein
MDSHEFSPRSTSVPVDCLLVESCRGAGSPSAPGRRRFARRFHRGSRCSFRKVAAPTTPTPTGTSVRTDRRPGASDEPPGAPPELRLEPDCERVAHRGAGREGSEVESLTDIRGRPDPEDARTPRVRGSSGNNARGQSPPCPAPRLRGNARPSVSLSDAGAGEAHRGPVPRAGRRYRTERRAPHDHAARPQRRGRRANPRAAPDNGWSRGPSRMLRDASRADPSAPRAP